MTERLKEEVKRLITVLDSIENLIYVADMDTYEVLFINAWGKKTHGDVTGKKCWKVFQVGMNGPCSFCSNDKLVDAEGKPTGLYKWEKLNDKYNKWYYCLDRAIEWVDGRLVRLEIAIDITEQKRIEDELRIQRQAMDSSVNAIALADMQGILTYINPSFLSMWGYNDEKEVLEHSLLDFWYDWSKAQAVVDAIIEKGYWKGEIVSKKKDGQPLDLYLSASLVYNKKGRPIHMMASFIDITERKKAEEKIWRIEWMLKPKNAEHLQRKTSIPAPLYGDLTEINTNRLLLDYIGKEILFDIATDYLNLLETSAAIYEKNGDYALGLFSSGWCRFLDHASRQLCQTDDNRKALQSGKWLCHESCWTDASKVAIQKGKPVDIACHGGLRLYAVPIWANNEVVGSMNIGYGDPPQEPEIIQELSNKYAVNPNTLQKYSRDYQSRPPFIVDLAKERLRSSARLIGTLLERNLAEKELRKSEEKHRRLFETMAQGVIYQDKDGKITSANPAAERVLGLSFKEMQGKTSMDQHWQMIKEDGTPVPGEEHPAMIALRTGKKVGPVIRGVFHPDKNTHIWLNIIAIPLFQPDEIEPFKAYATLEDITEHKQVESKLKHSEALLKASQTLAHIGGWEYDVPSETITWTEEVYNIYGVSKEYDPSNIEEDVSFYAPHSRLVIEEAFQRAIDYGESYDLELEFINKQGDPLWVRTSGKPEQQDGKTIRITGNIMDITERKQMEETIQHQHKFQKVVANISYGFINTPGSQMDEAINHALYQIGTFFHVDRTYLFQFSSDDKSMSNTHEWCREGIEPQIDALQNQPVADFPWIKNAIQTKEYVFIPDVNAIDYEEERKEWQRQGIQSLICIPIKIKERAIGFIGMDAVTEKKAWGDEEISPLKVISEIMSSVFSKHQMEQKLRESEEKHRRLFETMAQGIIYQAADSKIISANPAAERVLGLSFKEMQGKTSMDPRWQMIKEDGTPVPGEEHPTMIALRTGRKVGPVIRGIFHPDKDSHVWLNITAIPLYQPGETEPFQTYATFEDITEKKQMEEALQEKTSIIDSLLQSTPSLITVMNNKGKYVMVSDTTAKIIGRARDEIIGKNIDELLPQQVAQDFHQNIKKIQEIRQSFIAVDRIQVDNQERVFETSLFPIPLKDDKVDLIGGIGIDITEQLLDKERIEAYMTELELRNFELQSVYDYLDGEIEKAMKIHERSLPKTFPQSEDLLISAFYQPAEKVGGDFYDTIKTGNKLITYLSDVTGHGLESALLSTFIKDMVNSYVLFTPEEELTTAGILRFLYEQYKKENYPEDYFISIYLAVLDLNTLRFEYLSAGFQDSPLVFSGDKDHFKLKNSGLPISSVFLPEQLNFNPKSISLSPSSTILFNTDGITEQFVGETHYGERLHEVFYKNAYSSPNAIVEAIKEDFRRFNNGSLQGADDITFLVMQIG